MSTIVRLVRQRLIFQETYACSRRCSSTVTKTAAVSVTRQPRRVTFLLDRVARAPSDANLSTILNEWVSQGSTFKRCDAIVLLHHLRNRKNYRSALQLYDWMQSSKLEITNGDQAIMIDLLCKAEGMASAENYFNSLCESEKTMKTYGSLLSCYCRERDLDKALKIFEEMKKSNYTTTLNYNNVLSLFYSVKQPERAISFIREMGENSIASDGYTYNLFINCLATMKNFDAIEAALEKMRSNGLVHTWFTYGNLATMYLYSGSKEKARDYLKKIEEAGFQNNRELFESCRTRLTLYSELNDEPGILRTWASLKSGFPKPSNTGYLMMLLALSKLGDRDKLEKFYTEWEERCSLFDYRLPNVLLEYYISRELIDEATSLYERLVVRKDEPNLRSLNTYAVLCVKNGQIDSALKYLETGLDKDTRATHRWFPPVETVNAFLDYFTKNDDRERAEKFIDCVKRMSHVDPDLQVLACKLCD